MKITKKHVLIFIVFDFLIFACIAYYFYNKPHKNIAESNADIMITDTEIFNAFEKDESAAIKKFVTGDPVVELSGIIYEMTVNADTTATIIFKDPKYSGDVSCTLIKEESSKLKLFKTGDKIKVKGQCSGMQQLIDKEVVMLRCIITK